MWFFIGLALGVYIGWAIFDRCNASQTEQEKVLEYMHKHGSITTKEAKEIGVKHVRSVICKLKRDGKAIHNVNPVGRTTARYEFK